MKIQLCWSRGRQDDVLKRTLKEKGSELDSSISGEGLLASSYKHTYGVKNVLAVKVITNL